MVLKGLGLKLKKASGNVVAEHKVHRVDETHSADRQRLLDRGRMVLHAISVEVHAARMEAKHAELNVALAEAQNGDVTQLQAWLESYQGDSESRTGYDRNTAELHGPQEVVLDRQISDATVCSSRKANASSPSAVGLSTRDTCAAPVRSWDSLLPYSLARLAALEPEHRSKEQSDSTSSKPRSACEHAAPSHHALSLVAASQDDDPHSLVSLAEDSVPIRPADAAVANADSDSSDLFNEEDSYELREKRSNAPLEFEILPELQVLNEVDRELDKPYSRSGRRGLLVSVIVHSIMIISLTTMTMHMPEETAGLGFDSSAFEGEGEVVEVMQAVDVAAPELAAEMPTEQPSSSVSNLPSVSGLSSPSASPSGPTTASASLSTIGTSANQASAITGGGKPSLSKVNSSFFGAAAGGNSFCYVIDASETMRDGPWETAKRELLRSLSTLKENQRFYIIFFNQEISALPRIGEKVPASTALYATRENLEHAQSWIESIRLARGAPPDEALEKAIELELDAIYFLADGATKRDVPGLLKKTNRTSDFISGEQIRVPIHTIAFYAPEVGRKLMQKIANENKGQFIYVADPRKK